MIPKQILEILQAHVPASATEYCFNLWKASPFELKLSKSRQTKVGDFTSRRSKAHPRITLNNDLNPYLFLTTYVHEVAHLREMNHSERFWARVEEVCPAWRVAEQWIKRNGALVGL